jgi:hypothetical protein
MRYYLLVLLFLFALPANAQDQLSENTGRIGNLELKVTTLSKMANEQKELLEELRTAFSVIRKALIDSNRKVRAMEICGDKGKIYQKSSKSCIEPPSSTTTEALVLEEETCECKSGSFRYQFSKTTYRTASYPASSLCNDTWTGGDKVATCTLDGWKFRPQ